MDRSKQKMMQTLAGKTLLIHDKSVTLSGRELANYALSIPLSWKAEGFGVTLVNVADLKSPKVFHDIIKNLALEKCSTKNLVVAAVSSAAFFKLEMFKTETLSIAQELGFSCVWKQSHPKIKFTKVLYLDLEPKPL